MSTANPTPVVCDRRQRAGDRRLPGLDGIRALAVALVLAYHGGIPGLQVAGFYGVDVFFVLSGFLITRLLLAESADRGRIRFAAFWSRRARRLLPGLLVLLLAADVYVSHFAPPGRYPGFRDDALSVVGYWSNWHFIQASSNYFSATGFPSLLTHTWSLAIEEQFYLVWPLVVWGGIRLARRTRANPAALLLGVSTAGSLASAAWMTILYRSGADASRLYYGTDTHAQSILLGCALAALASLLSSRAINMRDRSATLAATGALAGLVWAACSLGSSDPRSYQGGFLAVSLLAALLVATVVAAPSSPPARLLSVGPVAYIGRISYGMYLWYFPIFAVMDRSSTGLTGAGLFVVRCATDIVVAAISFHLVEQPVRGWRPQVRVPRRLGIRMPDGTGTLASGAAAAGVAALLLVAGAPAAGPVVSPAALAAQSRSSAGNTRGERILVFGDSTAATLGDDLLFSRDARQHRIALDVVPIFGCGLAVSAAVDVHGQSIEPPASCRTGSPAPDSWPALLRRAIGTFHPTVVLVVSGRWEVAARRATPGGPWVNITEPGDAAYIRSQLEEAASIITGDGATLALATAPCFSSGEQPDGDAWPEDSPARQNAYNSLVRQVSARAASLHPGSSVVMDLAGIVCPGGRFHAVIDGVTVRAPDGIHYPFFDLEQQHAAAPDTIAQVQAFGAWIEPRIIRELSGSPS